MAAALENREDFANVEVKRVGEKILIPEGMKIEEAITWLKRQRDKEEAIVSIHFAMKAFPLDGSNALYDVCQKEFGFADVVGEENPSGGTPPKMLGIKLADGSIKNVPWGRIQFPGFEKEEYIETNFDSSKMEFVIVGEIKRKNEGLVNKIARLTEEYLRTNSIYKGKTFKVDLSFMHGYREVPKNPEFLKVNDIHRDDVILSDSVFNEYAQVLFRIENVDICKSNNIPLKHGCILAGPYGTGKTILAKMTANLANQNGWTFIYIEDAKQTRDALRLAEIYAPAVVFAEDIDRVVSNERTDQVNTILNTLDGIDTKDKPIITIFTTNHLENINATMMRAGRIDTLIIMDPLSEVTGLKFIHRYVNDNRGNSLLSPDEDYTSAAQSLAGVVPAFAMDILQKAKAYRFIQQKDYVLPEFIISAAENSKKHQSLAQIKDKRSPEEVLSNNIKEVFNYLNKDNVESVNGIMNMLDEIKDNL